MMIRSFGILSVGKVMGATYAFFGFLIGGIFTLMSLAGAAAGGPRGGGGMAILLGVGAIVIIHFSTESSASSAV